MKCLINLARLKYQNQNSGLSLTSIVTSWNLGFAFLQVSILSRSWTFDHHGLLDAKYLALTLVGNYSRSLRLISVVGDMVAARRALEKYADMDPTFPSTREYQLLVDLADQVEAGDQDAFAGKFDLKRSSGSFTSEATRWNKTQLSSTIIAFQLTLRHRKAIPLRPNLKVRPLEDNIMLTDQERHSGARRGFLVVLLEQHRSDWRFWVVRVFQGALFCTVVRAGYICNANTYMSFLILSFEKSLNGFWSCVLCIVCCASSFSVIFWGVKWWFVY